MTNSKMMMTTTT